MAMFFRRAACHLEPTPNPFTPLRTPLLTANTLTPESGRPPPPSPTWVTGMVP